MSNPIEQRIYSIQWDIEFCKSEMEELKKQIKTCLETDNDNYIATFITGYANSFKENYEKVRVLENEMISLQRIKEYVEKED